MHETARPVDVPADAAVDVSDVLGGAPAAVLLVSQSAGRVVHANPVAAQLAPGLDLPADLDAWSDAAGLLDLDGGLLSATDHPLSDVAATDPAPGQAVSAARDSDLGRERRPLWVVAVPLHGAPQLDDLTLVVMLPIRLRGLVEAAREQVAGQVSDQLGETSSLHSRAVVATDLSFTLADATDPELPLVWVNPAFTAATGYTLEDSIGHNCRFLQGPATDPAERRRIRDALESATPITTTILNYRKDGTAYWNQVNISPVHSAEGELTHFVGIQTDVSGRIEADLARDEALRAEQLARQRAEAAEQRLRLLADTSAELAGAPGVGECYRRLVDILVPRVGDLAVVLHVDDNGRVAETTTAHADPAQRERLAGLAGALPHALREGPVVEVLVGEDGGRLLTDLDTETGESARSAFIGDAAFRDRQTLLGVRSSVLVPLPGRSRTSDVLVVSRGPGRAQLDEGDLSALVDLGTRVGLILENARLNETQRHIAETLQHSLLPELRPAAGLRCAARYRPVSAGAAVGGDFYDLIALRDGRTALVVGDVVGHDVMAAAAMGHLRGLLRACVHDAPSPARALERVDTLLADLGMETLATVVLAFLEPGPAEASTWHLTWSNAGHPPLVVRSADGVPLVLGPTGEDTSRFANDTLVGLGLGARHDHRVSLPAGSVLVGCTDGLVERRGEVIDAGLRRLYDAVAAAPPEPALLVDELIERLLGEAGAGEHDDDVVVLAVELGHRS